MRVEGSPHSPRNDLSTDTFEAKLNIDKEGSTLSWEFSTKSHDIGFGVFYSPDGDAKVQ